MDMIIYHMIRHKDLNGNTGTGHVATIYDICGACILIWKLPNTLGISSIVLYTSLEDCKKVHGHGGKTIFICATKRAARWFEPLANMFLQKLFHILVR